MSFFDDLTKKAKAVAATASVKAKDAAESARISAAIIAEKRELDKNYRAIGQWYICEHEGEETPAAIADLVSAVHASQEKIAELQASKEKAEDMIVISSEDVIVDDAEDEDEPAGRVCPICGKINDSKFCPHCGAPMGE